ncbi:putative transmembrane protein [Cavenderia fasciculata]|uniref:Transmembrane protein n=1 Tax=Cavenderia fasciculata TaxID=261658 RepID=F4PJB1_CACFS|nr:putative transmembrane protein [Cavenderia fasciculata]EGG24397.1 putative transmembrane protein [Cavenderia fasciculata]|eukprot:XP_004362248.1 putative transmembrane protein [Cavenderia fasciculata]
MSIHSTDNYRTSNSNSNRNTSSSTLSTSSSSDDNKNIVEEIKKLDINLNRLIQSCEKLISTDSNNKDIITVEKYVPVLFTKLRQIKELIENYSIGQGKDNVSSPSIFRHVTKGGGSGKGTPTTESSPLKLSSIAPADNVNNIKPYQIPTKEVLNEYTRKVNVLFGLINQGKLESPISNKLSMIRLQSSYIPHAQKMNEVHAVLKTKNKEEKKKTDILLQNDQPNSHSLPSSLATSSMLPSIASPSLHFRNTFKNRNEELKQLLGEKHGGGGDGLFDEQAEDDVDSSFKDVTLRQKQLQTDYTDEMVSSSKYLKEYSERMSTKLTGDNHKIDELSSILTNNHSKIGEQNDRLKTYLKESSSDTLNYCIIIIVVILVFMGTYMLMKMSPKTN